MSLRNEQFRQRTLEGNPRGLSGKVASREQSPEPAPTVVPLRRRDIDQQAVVSISSDPNQQRLLTGAAAGKLGK
jgi:hypothetical protein